MPNDTVRKVQRVGILEMAAPDAERLALWDLFKQGLHDLGHAEGGAIAFEFRWAEGRTERLAGAADELVGLNVDVLVTAGTPAAAAASRATADIPIVMATGVGLGTQMTAGAAARNANVTGISDLPAGISAKRLQLLRGAVPDAPLALLADRGNPSSPLALRETQTAAREAGIALKDYWIETAADFAAALAAMRSDGIGGCVVAPGALFFAERKALAALAIERRIALIAPRREYAEAGCLMAYGAPIRDNYRQAARYVSQILRGAKPADLPVGEPAEFDLVLNLKTAQALSLTLPRTLSATAETI
jgi:putative tryptophan/tyrosine transport system substrate-binding protein